MAQPISNDEMTVEELDEVVGAGIKKPSLSGLMTNVEDDTTELDAEATPTTHHP